jgi:hypothetical protein
VRHLVLQVISQRLDALAVHKTYPMKHFLTGSWPTTQCTRFDTPGARVFHSSSQLASGARASRSSRSFDL